MVVTLRHRAWGVTDDTQRRTLWVLQLEQGVLASELLAPLRAKDAVGDRAVEPTIDSEALLKLTTLSEPSEIL